MGAFESPEHGNAFVMTGESKQSVEGIQIYDTNRKMTSQEIISSKSHFESSRLR